MIRLMSVSFSGLSKSDEKYFLSQIEDPDDGVIILFYLYPGEEDKLKSDLYKKITKSALPVLFRHETMAAICYYPGYCATFPKPVSKPTVMSFLILTIMSAMI